jgi:hypothetical protein
VQQRRGHRADISDSEGSDAEVDGDNDAAALLPAAEGVERALRDMAATGWSETVAIESSEEGEEEEKRDEEKVEEEEDEEEEDMQGQQADEHCVNDQGAGDDVAPAQAHAAVDSRHGTAAEAPPPAQLQPGAAQASASQSFSAAPTSIVSVMTAAAITWDVTAAAAAPAPAPQLASTSKTPARAPLRRASHFYVQRQLEDIDEAEVKEEKEKVRGHASACNASCGPRCACEV